MFRLGYFRNLQCFWDKHTRKVQKYKAKLHFLRHITTKRAYFSFLSQKTTKISSKFLFLRAICNLQRQFFIFKGNFLFSKAIFYFQRQFFIFKGNFLFTTTKNLPLKIFTRAIASFIIFFPIFTPIQSYKASEFIPKNKGLMEWASSTLEKLNCRTISID